MVGFRLRPVDNSELQIAIGDSVDSKNVEKERRERIKSSKDDLESSTVSCQFGMYVRAEAKQYLCLRTLWEGLEDSKKEASVAGQPLYCRGLFILRSIVT
jgi:hypothetical protein